MFTERGADNEARISIREFFRRYPVVLLLAAVTLSADLCYKMMIPLVPLLFAGRGWSKVLAGAAQSGFVLSETALKPITGGLGDRVKRTNLVMLSLAVGMVTPFFYAKAQGPGAFLALRLIDGAGAAALWPAIIALFADATDEKHRATAMSVFTICMLCSLGIGFTLAPLIKATFGDYEHVFATMSLLMVCAMVLTVWSSKRICRAVKAGVDARARAADPATMAQNLKKLLTDWPVLGQLATLIFIAFMQMMGTSMVTHTTFFFLFDELGWEEKDLWYVIPLAGAGIALLALPAGRLADVAGREAAVSVDVHLRGMSRADGDCEGAVDAGGGGCGVRAGVCCGRAGVDGAGDARRVGGASRGCSGRGNGVSGSRGGDRPFPWSGAIWRRAENRDNNRGEHVQSRGPLRAVRRLRGDTGSLRAGRFHRPAAAEAETGCGERLSGAGLITANKLKSQYTLTQKNYSTDILTVYMPYDILCAFSQREVLIDAKQVLVG